MLYLNKDLRKQICDGAGPIMEWFAMMIYFINLLQKICIYLASSHLAHHPLSSIHKCVQMSHSFEKWAFCNVLKGNSTSLVPLQPFEGDCKHRVKCTLCFLEIDTGFVTFTMWGCTLESKTSIKYKAAWDLLAAFWWGFLLWRWTFLSERSCHTQCSLIG